MVRVVGDGDGSWVLFSWAYRMDSVKMETSAPAESKAAPAATALLT